MVDPSSGLASHRRTQPVAGRPVDHNDMAEMALIGAMLQNAEAVAHAVAHLVEADLYRPHHAIIWRAIINAAEWGDWALVGATLTRTGEISRIPRGVAYLHDCLIAAPIPEHIGRYVHDVLAAATVRRRGETIARLTQANQEDDPDAWWRAVAASTTSLDPAALPAAGANGHRRHVNAHTAQDDTMSNATWLYSQLIPAGAITLLAGREGIGKSSIACDLAGRVSRGELPGHWQGTPAPVGIVATEDAWEQVVLPRLVAARADLALIYRIEASTPEGQPDQLTLPVDTIEATALCQALGLALLILDPIMSVVAAQLDTHKDREVRQALDPLTRLAAASGTAVLGLIHANKTPTTDPLNSVMGSRAFPAVARSVLYCITDPENEAEDRYVLGHAKSNLGPKQSSLSYHVIQVELQPDPDTVIITSRVVWDGEDDRSVADIMGTKPARAESASATRVLAWFQAQGPRTVPAAEVAAAFGDMRAETLHRLLARLAGRGKLSRPMHGMYSLPRT